MVGQPAKVVARGPSGVVLRYGPHPICGGRHMIYLVHLFLIYFFVFLWNFCTLGGSRHPTLLVRVYLQISTRVDFTAVCSF